MWHSGAVQCSSGGCRMWWVWHWSGAHRTDTATLAIVQLTACQAAGVKRALEITFSDQRVRGSVETKFTPGETLENLLAGKGRAPCAL